MTRKTVQMLLENIEILKHFAQGGNLAYKSKNCAGEYHMFDSDSITASYIENYIPIAGNPETHKKCTKCNGKGFICKCPCK